MDSIFSRSHALHVGHRNILQCCVGYRKVMKTLGNSDSNLDIRKKHLNIMKFVKQSSLIQQLYFCTILSRIKPVNLNGFSHLWNPILIEIANTFALGFHHLTWENSLRSLCYVGCYVGPGLVADPIFYKEVGLKGLLLQPPPPISTYGSCEKGKLHARDH